MQNTQLQQLTDSQRKLISKTEEAGELTPVNFARKVLNFTKIKFLTRQDVGPALGYIFQNIALLSGIKEPISDINKQDIKKMIMAHYSNMALEEIIYAFELERYNLLQPKSDHFQLLNAEYVAEILTKYKEWLSKTRRDYNLPISKAKTQEEILSEEKKEQIMISGCERCFKEFKSTGTVKEGNSHIYDYLFDELKIHKFTVDEKNAAIKVAKKNLKEESKTVDRDRAKNILKSLEDDNSKPVINQAKRLLLMNYFDSLGNKDITYAIKKLKQDA